MQLIIYGAKSIALGVGLAVKKLYPECRLLGFAVSSLKDNPTKLMGMPVEEIANISERLDQKSKKEICIVVATPETLFLEISEILIRYGFGNIIYMDSHKEAVLMERYFGKEDFSILHKLTLGKDKSVLRIGQAKFYKDKELEKTYISPVWCIPLQVGSDLTEIRMANLQDNTGENISYKNPNYCELSGLYWMWKNQILREEIENGNDVDYYGLFHYRRILDIREEDLFRLRCNDVDVVLPFPTIHEPDIKEHHQRYIQESDWEAMLQALRELQPKYADAYAEIFSQEYLYNYNIIVAKKQVLADYCAWLFPILERTEELSTPKGWERADRYIGYIGENLLSLYFMYHKKDLKIVHTERIMLT